MSRTVHGRSTITSPRTPSAPSSSAAATGCSPIPWPAPMPVPTSIRWSRPARPTASIPTPTWSTSSASSPLPKPPTTSNPYCLGQAVADRFCLYIIASAIVNGDVNKALTVSLAINFNGEFVAEWWVSADVHAFIMDDKNQAGHGYGIADSSDVCSTPLWLSKQRHKRNLTMKPEVTGRLAAIAFNCHRKRP